jgi:hypothetical protein
MQKDFGTRCRWLLGLALAVGWVAVARAEGPPRTLSPIGPSVLPWQEGQFGPFFGTPEPVKLSEYWLGLACSPAPPALRAQLKLGEGEGLVVDQVAPDSPAAKAGIEQYDVLVRAGDKPLGKLQDLIDAVDAAKDKPLALKAVRGGKSIEIKVTPAKRPEAPETVLPGEKNRRPGEVPPWGEGKLPWRFRFWGPGWILPPEAKPEASLPDNVSVTITRSGDKPARIVVKRGDEKWEVTEDQLDKLPDDVRGPVERMLGQTPGRHAGKGAHDFDFVPEWPTPHWEGVPQGQMEKRMEEMSRRIEEMRKAIEQLRENRPRLKAAPKLKEVPAPKESAPAPAEKAPEHKGEKI